jgi:hypothetical protein
VDFKLPFPERPAGLDVIPAVGPDGPVALTPTSVSSLSADAGERESVQAAHRAQLAALWR